MELFERLEQTGHERVLVCSNPDVGLRAIIAIHSTTLGPSLGGLRMWPFQSFEEALIDVLRLSRTMTYKAAAAGLNLGGGKAVILGDPKTDKSEVLLRSFGRYVDSLGGLYITAEDVGTDMEDMEVILTETRWVTGVSPAHGGGGDPAPVTAHGVLQGIKAACRWSFDDDSLAGRTVAVQGLGSVGSHLAAGLAAEGAKVFGADVDAEAAERAAAEHGVEIVAPEEVLRVECDVLAPCALGAVLNTMTIPELRCRIVAGGANNQLDREDRDGRELLARGILYAPDFLINAGGIINVYNELLGNYRRERAERMTRAIYVNLMRVFGISKAEGIPTHAAAVRMAEERINDIRKLGARHWGRVLDHR
jgi:leucine dehydrogenase